MACLTLSDSLPVSCENPRVIVNPYTKEPIIVSCGCCPTCCLRRGASYFGPISRELASSACCYFVTLTYNNISCPREHIVKDSSDNLYLKESQKYLSQNEFADYRKKSSWKFNTSLPCFSRSDAKSFLSRLRASLYKYCNSISFRYYFMCEYGSLHFRPHYHVLLFFQRPINFELVKKYCVSSWKRFYLDRSGTRRKYVRGNVFVREVRVNQTNSIGKYLSCYVCPGYFKYSFLQRGQFKPFFWHSFHLGERPLEKYFTNPYEDPFVFINGVIDPAISRDKPFTFSNTILSRFWPKCYRYFDKNDSRNIELYTLSEKLPRRFRSLYDFSSLLVDSYKTGKRITFLSADLYELFMQFISKTFKGYKFGSPISLTQNCFKNVIDFNDYSIPYRLKRLVSQGDKLAKILTSAIYRILRTSRKFLSIVNKFNFKIREFYGKIKNFYDTLSLKSLSLFYTKLERLSLHCDNLDWLYFTPSQIEHLQLVHNTSIVCTFEHYFKHVYRFSDMLKRSSSIELILRMKHKSLNDKYNILQTNFHG